MALPIIDLDTALDTQAAAQQACEALDAYRSYASLIAERRAHTERGLPVPQELDLRLSDAAGRIPPAYRW